MIETSTNRFSTRNSLPVGRLFINGEWRSAENDRMRSHLDPTTEEPNAEIAEASEADMLAAIESARRAKTNHQWTPNLASIPRKHCHHDAVDDLGHYASDNAII
jgi:hypothetical protein